jgi:hypothetical protein
MRERGKARATAIYFAERGHKDLANQMLLQAIECERKAYGCISDQLAAAGS